MRFIAPLVSLLVCGAALAASSPDQGTTYSLPPEISHTLGQEGGVVLLWPRVIPATDDAQSRQDALFVQDQLKGAITRALAGRVIDTRPEPERVCQQAGCKGIAVGAVLLHKENGCAVMATVSAPGRSQQKLVTMAGQLSLTADLVPFREPPESYVVVHDFDRCVDLGPNMALRMAALEGALRDAAGLGSAPTTGTTTSTTPTRVVISGVSPQ